MPDSRCVRVVTPDDHVNIGFHEVLIHDLCGIERTWMPSLGLAEDFVYIHVQISVRSGSDAQGMPGAVWFHTVGDCGKHIPQNLGKHIALYHMELAQLWHCPVTWCTVWKGTTQDWVDHMRKAHDIPPLVKAANLARWFPPWTVAREQWSSMSRPAVSGIAVDTLLFSRIGVPLFHRYRVVYSSGTHGAFRSPYMRQLHAFLEESDAASLHRRHRRCARDIAARMSRTSIRDTEDKTPVVSSQPKVTHRSVSRARRPTMPVAVAGSSSF